MRSLLFRDITQRGFVTYRRFGTTYREPFSREDCLALGDREVAPKLRQLAPKIKKMNICADGNCLLIYTYPFHFIIIFCGLFNALSDTLTKHSLGDISPLVLRETAAGKRNKN
jgi:hypothetical protein